MVDGLCLESLVCCVLLPCFKVWTLEWLCKMMKLRKIGSYIFGDDWIWMFNSIGGAER